MSHRMNVFRSRVGTEVLMGRIIKQTTIGIERIPCAQVRATMNEFNIYLKKYFGRSFDFWALDRQSIGGLGDTVLIRRLDGNQRPTASVSHHVEKVIFQYGNVMDPVTGKRVIAGTFSDELELKKKLVEEIIDQPLEEEAIMFDERRALQSKKLEEAKESSV